MPRLRRLEAAAIVATVLLLVGVPTVLRGPLATWVDVLTPVAAIGGGCALAWWRSRPRIAAVVSLASFFVAAPLGGWFPETGLVLFSAAFAVLALGWGGRSAWVAGVCGAAYVAAFGVVARIDSVVTALMLAVPPYVAGTALRLRRETSVRLAERARELEAERELYAEIALRHERARIAGELHDIVGHAISVMVIQAAAGTRLVGHDRVRAQHASAAIAESAKDGSRDLVRLVDLLGRGVADPVGTPDLELVDEVVRRAASSGLRITCRLRGERATRSAPRRVPRSASTSRSTTASVSWCCGSRTTPCPPPPRRSRGRATDCSGCGSGWPRTAAGSRRGRRHPAAGRWRRRCPPRERMLCPPPPAGPVGTRTPAPQCRLP